jgi:hypothetical protein
LEIFAEASKLAAGFGDQSCDWSKEDNACLLLFVIVESIAAIAAKRFAVR